MIIAVRISGLVEIPQKVNESLFRLRLRRKYTSVLLLPTRENLLILKKLRNTIAYGVIDTKTLGALVAKRGQLIDKKKKLNAESVVTEILNQEKKGKLDLSALGIKPFFRLHPPRGGMDSKVHFPIRKGVLGDNKEKINDLVGRML
jgi:large subunit ribosomal protein L30